MKSFERKLFQYILTILILLVIVGIIIINPLPTISVYIIIPGMSGILIVLFIHLLRNCYLHYYCKRVIKALHVVTNLMPTPPIVIIQGNNYLIGTPVEPQPKQSYVPMYVANVTK